MFPFPRNESIKKKDKSQGKQTLEKQLGRHRCVNC